MAEKDKTRYPSSARRQKTADSKSRSGGARESSSSEFFAKSGSTGHLVRPNKERSLDDYVSFLTKVYIDQFRSVMLELVTRGNGEQPSINEEILASAASEAESDEALVAEISLAALADPKKVYSNIKRISREDAEMVRSLVMGEVHRFLPWEVWEYVLDKFPYLISDRSLRKKYGRISSGSHHEESQMRKISSIIPDDIRTEGWPSEISTSLLDPAKLVGVRFSLTDDLERFLDSLERHAPEVSYELADERTAVFPRIVERYVSELAKEIALSFELVQIKSVQDLSVHERDRFEASRKTRILGRFD